MNITHCCQCEKIQEFIERELKKYNPETMFALWGDLEVLCWNKKGEDLSRREKGGIEGDFGDS